VRIDWAALGIVAVVLVVMTLIFVVLLSYGIRFVSAARAGESVGRSGSASLTAGYALLAGSGLLVLFGLWLIVPQFH